MQLFKTDKAREELQPGRRTLSQRERALLLIADGRHTTTHLVALFGDAAEASRVAHTLIERGYLHLAAPPVEPSLSSSPSSVAQAADRTPEPIALPATDVAASTEPAAANEHNGLHEPLGGTRSLATTRQFLLALCEDIFAQREPTLADALREDLQEASDRDAMLTMAYTVIVHIESRAGTERAEAVRERVEQLLPTDDLAR